MGFHLWCNPCRNLAVLSTAPNHCRNLAVLVLRTLRVIAICARPSETLETTGGAVQNLTLTLPLGFQVVGLVKLHIGQHGGRRGFQRLGVQLPCLGLARPINTRHSRCEKSGCSPSVARAQ